MKYSNDIIQSYKFKEFAKTSNFLILKKKIHTTHLLKLLDKMCKYEMDLASIVEDTERTIFCPQTERRTRWNQYTPLQLCWAEVITNDQRMNKPMEKVIPMSPSNSVGREKFQCDQKNETEDINKVTLMKFETNSQFHW